MSANMLTDDLEAVLPDAGMFTIRSFALGRSVEVDNIPRITFATLEAYTVNSAQRMFAPHIAADPNLSVYIARTVYDLTDSAQRIALAVALGKSNAAVCEGQK